MKNSCVPLLRLSWMCWVSCGENAPGAALWLTVWYDLVIILLCIMLRSV